MRGGRCIFPRLCVQILPLPLDVVYSEATTFQIYAVCTGVFILYYGTCLHYSKAILILQCIAIWQTRPIKYKYSIIATAAVIERIGSSDVVRDSALALLPESLHRKLVGRHEPSNVNFWEGDRFC